MKPKTTMTLHAGDAVIVFYMPLHVVDIWRFIFSTDLTKIPAGEKYDFMSFKYFTKNDEKIH